AKKAGIIDLGAGSTLPSTYKRYPYRIDTASLNSIREGSVTINGLHRDGYFNDKGAKYGFVTWDDPDYHAAYDHGYLPALRHYGITPVTAFLHSPATPQEVGQTSADANSAILRFQSQGINHVMILDGPSGRSEE